MPPDHADEMRATSWRDIQNHMDGQGISNEYPIEAMRRFHVASLRTGRTAVGLAAVAIGVALASIAIALVGIGASSPVVTWVFVAAAAAAIGGLCYAVRSPTRD